MEFCFVVLWDCDRDGTVAQDRSPRFFFSFSARSHQRFFRSLALCYFIFCELSFSRKNGSDTRTIPADTKRVRVLPLSDSEGSSVRIMGINARKCIFDAEVRKIQTDVTTVSHFSRWQYPQ